MIHQPIADVVRNRTELPTAGRDAAGTPAAVHAARAILVVQGAIVLAAGVLLARNPDPQLPAALGVISIVEGALRILAAAALRRGARILRKVVLGFCVIGAVLGFVSGGIAIVGALLSVAVVRCLNTDEAKHHFAG